MTKLVTPQFRAAYVSLFKAVGMKDDPSAKKKYVIRAVFDPEEDLSALKQAAQTALVEKWGKAIPKNAKSPFRLNGELDNPVQGLSDDAVVINFSAPEERAPGIVGPNLEDITDEIECYAGAYYRAHLSVYAYDTKGNKGVAFGLQNVQKVKDGEPLGGSRMPANKAFEPVSNENGAAGLF